MRKTAALLMILLAFTAKAQVTRNYQVVMRIVGNHTLHDGTLISIFGFSPTMSQPITLPGKTLYCNEGDTVIIDARNISQGEHHSIHLHGLDVDTRNDGDPSTSFWLEHMQDTTYTFVAHNAGTYIYHCHVADVVHVQMGMYGLIVVKAANGANNAWTGGPMFHRDYKWLMTEVDVDWHDNIPQHDPLVDTVNLPPYQPGYFLINGKSQGQLAADDSIKISGAQGEYIYMRLANIGFFNNRVIFPPSLNATIIDSDGRPLPSAIVSDTVEIMPGERFGVMLSPSSQFTGTVAVEYLNMNTDSVWGTENVPVNISGYVGQEESAQGGVQLYPNPASDFVEISSKSMKDIISGVRIFDLVGKLVDSHSAGSSLNVKVDISKLVPGVYLVEVTAATGSFVQKLFIE